MNEAELMDLDHPLLQKHSGLTTEEALSNLYSEILKFANDILHQKKTIHFYARIMRNAFHHSSHYSTLSWIPVCILILVVVTLLVFTQFRIDALIILTLTLLNVIIICWDNYLRLNEFSHSLTYILKMLKKAKKKNNWRNDQYPNLFTPNSPAVSLQWTIRDGKVINLPSVLLAKGDIIILRPGQFAPAPVQTIYPAPSPEDKFNFLTTDQLFTNESTTGIPNLSQSNLHKSIEQPLLNDRLYVVLNAPYIALLKSWSERLFERPISLYEKARHLLFSKCLHHKLLPIFLISCELLAAVRWYIFSFLHFENFPHFERWTYYFIVESSSMVVPLISLVFPVFWFVSNTLGNAVLLSSNSYSESQLINETKKNVQQLESSYFDDIEASFKSFSEPNIEHKSKNRPLRLFLSLSHNDRFAMIRHSNFLHTMASVTVFCCVDKKGVLSFPNPIAEKVFFLRNSGNHQSFSKNGENSRNGKCTVTSNYEDTNITGNLRKLADDCSNDKSIRRLTPSAEILDITPRDEKGSAWKIEFDNSLWKCHLSSLKPLGLAILVNTCNKKTHETYNNFYSFITNHAVQHKHLVPVANRRCLCELARQIGFHEKNIEDKYKLELQLFSFKKLAETPARNKYVQAIFKTRKPKFPFPHAMSVTVSHNDMKNSPSLYNNGKKDYVEESKKRKLLNKNHEEKQMFSQGTADIILDFCVDYWDGCNVYPLTPSIRKKILDFYQRSSLTAYCTAFSYKPVHKNLRKVVHCGSETAVYVELLKNIESLAKQCRCSRNRLKKNREMKNCDGNVIFSSKMKGAVPLQKLTECDEEIDDNFGDKVEDYDEDIDYTITNCGVSLECEDNSEESIEEDDEHSDAPSDDDKTNGCQKIESYSNTEHQSTNYFQILGKQIFLGMVSMQYQPLIDMIQMIEELEKACIRFVHFSKENELRSRVFSEKMGLESGWNCHISLLPDAESKLVIEGMGNENINLPSDYEMNSAVDTGASSADDEENVPISFDLSNRAKLPCGIKNIKPHLEQVDNVPLLVSLFTDCTSDTTEQMLTIMQEYGQIVCVLGSSANTKNFVLFARADSSISVEPLYAQVCQQIPSSLIDERGQGKCPSPTELSQILNSMPCSLILQRNYNYQRILPVYSLIAESRNLMRLVWNCVQFWLCCIALTFTVQVSAVLLLLPAIFTLEQALWISIIIIPCFSISLMSADYDDNIMTKAKGKDWLCSINWTTMKYTLICYGSKLISSIVVVIASYFIELMCVCNCLRTVNGDIPSFINNTATQFIHENYCVYLYFLNNSNNEKIELLYSNSLNIIQSHMALILCLNLVALCLSFLHRDVVFWEKVPKLNSIWMLLIFIPLTLQITHFIRSISHSSSECLLNKISFVSVESVAITILSPCLSYIICELTKIHEIRVNERYQKKVRLEFGTKLGMNSPF